MDDDLAQGVAAMIAECQATRVTQWRRKQTTTARDRTEHEKARAASLRRRQADRLARGAPR
jgi:hypothetical protein